MTDLALEPASVENFAGLLQQLCPRSTGFVIYGNDGDWVSTSPAVGENARVVVGQLTPQELVGSACMERLDCDDGSSFYAMALMLPNDVFLGTLLVEIKPATASERPTSDADIYSDLIPFLTCLVNELRLNHELDELATELTARYEELNLVYHTEDQVSVFDEGQNALRQLLNNCIDYLNVSIAVLFVPEKGLFVVSGSNRKSNELLSAEPYLKTGLIATPIETEIVEQSVRGALWDVVRANNEVVVINSVSDANAIGLPRQPYKFLASPVAHQDGDVDGVLVAVNDVARRDFSNSDKNLLGVMARKVSKIILSSYDDLTGLVNLVSFEHLVERNRKAIQQTSSEHSLIYLYVDRLSMINDTRGRETGDRILKMVTGRLRMLLRDSDIIARIGGDKFGLLILNCTVQQGEKLAEKIREDLQALELADGAPIKISCSIGVTCVSGLTQRTEDSIVAANVACDLARELGGNRVQAYAKGDNKLLTREQQMFMVDQLHSVLKNDQLELYSQLIVPLSKNEKRHAEILLRMVGEGGEIMTPEKFLPAAERYQLMTDVDKWVVRQACSMLAKHSAETGIQDTVFGVNLSGQSLSTDGFDHFVSATMREFGIPGSMICFEITETAVVANLERALDFIAAMKAKGCTFALDDFGAGMSSFGYLKTFPVDFLKIDGKLVKDVTLDKVAESMVAAIHQIGHVMGIKTIAEYVDSAEIVEKLRDLGVDFAQGFLIQKPRPLKDQLDEWRSQKLATVI